MDRLTSMTVFRAVVEEEGFARAARRLGLSNAAVSKHVAALEEALGVRLLQRTTRRSRLTSSGQAYYERCCRILDDLLDLERDVRSEGEVPRGTLRVSAPMSFGLTRLAPLLPGLLAEHPELRLEVSFTDRMVDLIEEGFDVALRITTHLADSSLIAARIAGFRRIVCASPGYLARAGTPGTPAELGEHACLVYTRSAEPRVWTFEDVEGERHRVEVSGPFDLDSSIAMREPLLAGTAIALVPSFVVGEELASGRLVEILSGFSAPPVTLWALHAQSRHLSPKVRALVGHLRGQVQGDG